MSVYKLNKILYLLDMDEAFLQKVKNNPADAIKDFDLTPEERRALLDGDVGTLYRMGVHTFILNSTVRHEVFGVTRDDYIRRIQAVARDGHGSLRT
jgi:hypothetical protein